MNSKSKIRHYIDEELGDSAEDSSDGADSSDETDIYLISMRSSLNSIANPSTSKTNFKLKELSVKTSKSEALEQKHFKEKLHTYYRLNVGPKLDSPVNIRKQNADQKSDFGPKKKMKLEEDSRLPESQLELMDPCYNSLYNEELDDEISSAGSIEYNCSTPEYLKEEFLDEVDSDGDIVPDERGETKNGETKSLNKDETVLSKVQNVRPKLVSKNMKSCGFTTPDNDGKSCQQLTISSNKASNGRGFYTPESTHNRPRCRNSTPKTSDKTTELLVPANLNQYGDCLKTRLGRYNYGLTHTDPPSQFFQGVLKGASGQTLAAIFGDVNLISKLDTIPKDEIGHFVIDTTYKVIPNSTAGVKQVLTINLLLQNQTIPLWFAITSCSSPELYKRILIEFQQHVLDWPFTSILLNADPALCKGVRSVMPDIKLYGSWFYYCHSIWYELTFNNLTERCKADSTMMLAVKMLMVVPYLPPNSSVSPHTMKEGFEIVRRFAQKNAFPIEFHRVLDYVATFWFDTVKTNNFTVYGNHTRAVNYVEVFQIALLSFMKPNGNVWTLTRSFQNTSRSANTEVNRYLNGKKFLTKKNRAKKYNVLIRQNAKHLRTGEINVRTFLEKSTVYCEEMLDIFLHPLYSSETYEKNNCTHIEGWKIRIK